MATATLLKQMPKARILHVDKGYDGAVSHKLGERAPSLRLNVTGYNLTVHYNQVRDSWPICTPPDEK